jgi:hypothetical protein
VETTVEGPSRTERRLVDAAVHGLILALGALQFFMYRHSGDFVGDATYYELARSLHDEQWYGFNFRPETMLPPGFAVIVAAIWWCFGGAYSVLIRTTAVFTTLFLSASHELLRREVGRAPAAAICLITGTSPFLFSFSTRSLFSDVPYAFTSTLTLLVAVRLCAVPSQRSRVILWLLLAPLLVCSLMIRSVGISILAALVAWVASAVVTKHPGARLRLKAFLPLIALGFAVQALWMTWSGMNERTQWSLKGYPGSYISQIKLKVGNYPELGKATLEDLVSRVQENVAARSAGLLGMLSRRWIDPAWNSPVVLGTVLLTLLGLRRSPWVGASGLLQWYFVCYEGMYLLWPWKLELRFLLPIVPLACIYLWRGGQSLFDLIRRRRLICGACTLAVSVVMALYSANLMFTHQQGRFSTAVWVLLVVCSARMTWTAVRRGRGASSLFSPGVLRAAAAGTVIIVVSIGLFMQVCIGLENVYYDKYTDGSYPDIEAAEWLASHTGVDAVVMARKVDLTYHYSRRKVVWFPPISDPKQLIEGIRRHKVEWVVVVDREESYFLPQDADCFATLLHAFPYAFHLVHRGHGNRIFQVSPLTARTVFDN